MKSLRCAIYTRKSSEEGLEQDFNSLDAQREACAAYILSQASEGWTALPDRYDDGGISGGTLERPGLKRLLADVEAGKVDVIVVYKVDRLSRSLFDFAKLVEAFEAAGTSFVSVTQSFNTTTSMGRLTLNMLLSFAQFEREVTAERIRDKIAASKAKGMWMGGNPPIGYAPEGRTLRIVPPEADQVRDIFERYLQLGTVLQVKTALDRERITTPPRVNGKGKAYGGCAWSRGQIYKLLSNPIYIGLIEHKGERYQGLHPAIIDIDCWEQVQAKLADNLQGKRERRHATDPSLLAGRIEDERGTPLIADHASKGMRRYRYYATRKGEGDEIRVPAREIEGLVIDRVQKLLDDPLAFVAAASLTTPAALRNLTERAGKLGRLARDRSFIDGLVSKVRILADRIEIICRTEAMSELLAVPTSGNEVFAISAPARITRSGRVVRLVDTNGAPLMASADTALIRLIARAHGWWAELRKGEVDISRLATSEGVQPSYMTRVLRLAFLSPRVTEAILKGRQSPTASVSELTLGAGVPMGWAEQEQRLMSGLAQRHQLQ